MYTIYAVGNLAVFLTIKFIQFYRYDKNKQPTFNKDEFIELIKQLAEKNNLRICIECGKYYMVNIQTMTIYIINRETYNSYDILCIFHEIGHLVRDRNKKGSYIQLIYYLLYGLFFIYFFICMVNHKYIGGMFVTVVVFIISIVVIIGHLVYLIYDEWGSSRFAIKNINESNRSMEYRNYLLMHLFTHILNSILGASLLVYLGYMVLLNI